MPVRGEIKLLMDSRLRWQGKEWDILGMPWMLNCGMMLRLRKVDGGRCQHLWLAADSMDAAEVARPAPDAVATDDAGVTRVS
ncbi:protein YgfX [Enterobacter asburiae]|uniref:Protein YgfX n=1 Tax=Enterobacter asburiae TaxID=61645 RepID=A0A376FEU9_ENTAS|nr:protein YgfX [Enterobacter asburiae]